MSGHFILFVGAGICPSVCMRAHNSAMCRVLPQEPRAHLVRMSAKTFSSPGMCSMFYSKREMNTAHRRTLAIISYRTVGCRAIVAMKKRIF